MPKYLNKVSKQIFPKLPEPEAFEKWQKLTKDNAEKLSDWNIEREKKVTGFSKNTSKILFW